jgi:hypothetical protein
MFDFIKSWIDEVVDDFNTDITLDTDKLYETSVNLDSDKVGANDLDKRYFVRITDYTRNDFETTVSYNITVSVLLTFGIYKNDVEFYGGIIDEYVHPLEAALTAGYTTTAASITSVNTMKVTALKDIVKLNYLQPEITFEAVYMEEFS